MLYAVPVGSTVATGRVASIDTAAAAEKMPGVRKIYTHDNVGKLYPLPKSSQGIIDERRPPLDDTPGPLLRAVRRAGGGRHVRTCDRCGRQHLRPLRRHGPRPTSA